MAEDVVKKLNELLMLDHDAVKAYSTAIDHINIPLVKEKLSEFRGDHQRHIDDLTVLIRRLGGQPKDHIDMKGPLIQAMTTLRAYLGNEQAIKAMKSNEELTNRAYARAVESELPEDAKEVVRRNYQDEVRHLAWINEIISRRIWEEREVHP